MGVKHIIFPSFKHQGRAWGKMMIRLMRANTGPRGDLDTDAFTRALLMYCKGKGYLQPKNFWQQVNQGARSGSTWPPGPWMMLWGPKNSRFPYPWWQSCGTSWEAVTDTLCWISTTWQRRARRCLFLQTLEPIHLQHPGDGDSIIQPWIAWKNENHLEKFGMSEELGIIIIKEIQELIQFRTLFCIHKYKTLVLWVQINPQENVKAKWLKY